MGKDRGLKIIVAVILIALSIFLSLGPEFSLIGGNSEVIAVPASLA